MHFQSLLITGLSVSTIARILPRAEHSDVIKPHVYRRETAEKTNADNVNSSEIKSTINTGGDGGILDGKDTKIGSEGVTPAVIFIDEEFNKNGPPVVGAVNDKDENEDEKVKAKDEKDKDENEDENEKVKAKGEKDKDENEDEDEDDDENKKVKAKGEKDKDEDEEKEAIDEKELGTKDKNDKISADKGDDDGDDKDEVGTKTNSKINYGKCSPAMSFKKGRPGRKAEEATFLPDDPLVAKGQQDALNPDIITNRICDQLVNVCEANDAAIKKCQEGKVMIKGLGTRDETTAKAWNTFVIV